MQGRVVGARTVGGVTAALLLLTACGSGSTTPAAAPSTTSAAATTSAPPSSPAPAVASGTRTLADGRKEITDTKAGLQIVLPASFAQVTDKAALAKLDGATFSAQDAKTGAGVTLTALPSLGVTVEDMIGKQTAKKTTVGGLPALRVDSQKAVSGATYTLSQIYTTKGDKMLIFTIGIAAKNAEKPVSDVIASVRFLD